jgi:hypothetical protein
MRSTLPTALSRRFAAASICVSLSPPPRLTLMEPPPLGRVAARLEKELPEHPEWKAYLQDLGGTFNWRTVAGTSQLSAHSFGIAIDLNPAHGAYWRWSKFDPSDMSFRLRFPAGIVEAFEAEGFIWGGKWWAYDLMHFEYRPEFSASLLAPTH